MSSSYEKILEIECVQLRTESNALAQQLADSQREERRLRLALINARRSLLIATDNHIKCNSPEYPLVRTSLDTMDTALLKPSTSPTA